ncbi:hypothetical protein [Arthrobacter crystallopoietes]|uniref:Uncharacterized protein n=1 Tax=Crystallibacter crystallopoietes TaxID=37928 RepID=A0A1H1EW89_9MICC|nr:hypothetical protein [Arthrobacter crystallopoietes]SDQ92426.1 hypothetical protein SAMN04489742_3100 [Arthrobacter crystallopoietes]
MSVFEKRPGMALAAGALALTAVAGSGLCALYLSGTPFVASEQVSVEEKASESAAAKPIFAEIRDMPAEKVLSAALAEPPKGWRPSGTLQRSASQPVPYSCAVNDTAPSVALSRLFSVDGDRVQVVTAAYTAGLGAEVMRQQVEEARSCAGSAVAINESKVGGKDPGVEAHRVFTYKGSSAAQVVSFRRGDVLAFLVGAPDAPLSRIARQLDDHLAAGLKDVCVDQKSVAADASRSPWSAAGYKPYMVKDKVAVRDVPLPTVPAGSGIEAVPLPGPKIKVEYVQPAADPYYAVWPPMPKQMDVPEPPKSPAKAAVTETSIRILAEDKQGPGCGWAFTGMSPMVFDAKAAEQTNAERRREASQKLTAGTQQWQQSVLDYWTAYDKYGQAADDYKDYAKEVRKVNKAWAAIGAEWDAYWVSYAAYESALGVRAQFFRDQENAEWSYLNALAQCEADNRRAAEQPKPKPKPEPEDSDDKDKDEDKEEPKEEEQEQPEVRQVDCDSAIGVPAILDWAPPPVPSEPAPPADPRPENRR